MFALLCSTTLLLFLCLIVLLYKYSTRKFDYWKKRNVFHLKPLPFVGNFLQVFLARKGINDWSWDMYKNIDKDYFGIYIFDQPHLVIKSAQLAKNILIKDFHHFQNREIYVDPKDDLIKHALFFAKNPGWKDVRSKVSPVYTSGKLKLMLPLIQEENRKMIEFIKTKTHANYLEMKEITAKYSTNLIAKCAYAIDANSFEYEDARFRVLSKKIFDFRVLTAIRQMSSFFLPDLVKLFGLSFVEKRITNELGDIFLDVLNQRKQTGELKSNDLIDLLLDIRSKHSKEEITDNMILAQAVQFFIAGFETVSSTISFALYELALNLDVQQKLRNEIDDLFKKNVDANFENINNMKYLDMVVSETLRKYPVLPFLDRRCNTDYKLPGTDLVIEKGIPVLVPMFGFHYDEKYFPNPTKFDPERFIDKTMINNNGLYYFPFGAGPRICIGERFGLLGVKTAIISLIKNFKIEKSSNTPYPLVFEPKSIVLQSKVGIPLRVVPL